MPEAVCILAVGAQRRGIDGAEHSSTIDRVMAAGSTCVLADPLADHLLPENIRSYPPATDTQAGT